ncbi:hypothetical protein SFC52_24160 [Niallia circulans]|uniref:hypothetical protein n=2 Tax=Bacillales TaxID=1385 RepID=UPI003982D2CC
MFQLPRKQDDLTELVTEKLYKNKKLIKSAITKLYSISEVEPNEYIIIERNTNIFLLNLYLLVLQEMGELAFTEKTTLNDDILLKKIEEKTNLNVSNLSVEEIEQLVLTYLYSSSKPNEVLKDTKDTEELFQNIEYSIDWIKKAHNQLNVNE